MNESSTSRLLQLNIPWLLALALGAGCAEDRDAPPVVVVDAGHDAGNPDIDAGFDPMPDRTITLEYDLTSGAQGWEAGFSDYPPAMAEMMDLVGEFRASSETPSGVPGAFTLQGSNTSDDLFMFMKKRVGEEEGVVPGEPYRVAYSITFWSDAPSGCAGIGGAPGESVFVKFGASDVEPRAELSGDAGTGDYRMNVDKGNQATGGEQLSVGGNVSNGVPCEEAEGYEQVTLSHEHDEPITVGDFGLWLIVGTDSGFEGRTQIYVDRIEVTLFGEFLRPR